MQKRGGTFTQIQKYMGKGIDNCRCKRFTDVATLERGDTRTQVSAVGKNNVGGLHGN